jgi:hypothetical protein
MWGSNDTGSRKLIGANPPASASWGHCDVDYPREAIVSPYPFKAAQEHYDALLAETKARGGPTVYTREHPPPDWNGRYSRAKMQTVEIFSPRRDPAGRLAGIEHEIVLYDMEAFAQPLRLVQVHIKTGQLSDVAPFIYARCIQTIFPVNGRPQPLSPGVTIEYPVPDMYGRPWAQIWERYFETGMKRPSDESLFEFK